MYRIEFFKILKRSYNYLFLLFITFSGLIVLFQKNKIVNYLEIDNNIFLFNYFLKIILFSVLLITVINVVISYREDYKNKVIILLRKFKVSSFNNNLAKVLMSFVFFLFYYVVVISILLGFLLIKKDVQLYEILSANSGHYLVYSALAILYSIVMVLLIISIFNNTNLALSLTLLFFIGSKFFASYLKSINSIFDKVDFTFINIFNVMLNDLSTKIESFTINSVSLSVNIIITFFIIVVFNRLRLK